MRLIIKNTTDLNVILDTEVTDNETSARFYNFDITLPEGVPDGEYEYVLKDGDNILSTGIMTICSDRETDKQYEKAIQYEQYETER